MNIEGWNGDSSPPKQNYQAKRSSLRASTLKSLSEIMDILSNTDGFTEMFDVLDKNLPGYMGASTLRYADGLIASFTCDCGDEILIGPREKAPTRLDRLYRFMVKHQHEIVD